MKVYVGGKNDSIQKVFSTREKADAWLMEVQLQPNPGSYQIYYWVRGFEVDA